MTFLAPLRPHELTWEDCVLGGGLRSGFESPDQPLEVEIGPGDDDFLVESAAAHPEHNWLGLEYSRKRVRRLIRGLDRRGRPLPNLRLIWRPAGDIVGPFLGPARVATFHIYFPDPWPKAHHARYRLLAPGFVRDLRAALTVGGRLDIATDAAAYAEEIRQAVAQAGGLVEARGAQPGAARPPGGRATAFEVRWRALGRAIHFLRFVKEGPACSHA